MGLLRDTGIVVGGLPVALQRRAEHKDLFVARNDVRDGIAATLEYARAVGLPLAIEPLHPMYAADRACVNTREQGLDLCDALDPGAHATAARSDAPGRLRSVRPAPARCAARAAR